MVAESAECTSERRSQRGSCHEQRDQGDAAIARCREPRLPSAQDVRMHWAYGKCQLIEFPHHSIQHLTPLFLVRHELFSDIVFPLHSGDHCFHGDGSSSVPDCSKDST